jgi:phosphotransferase system HPr (HPr) family protein
MSTAIEKKVTVPNELGLHLRAAGALVQVANRYQAEIQLIRSDISANANAKSIISVLSLAASKGVELLLRAEGIDAQDALEAVSVLIESGFVKS